MVRYTIYHQQHVLSVEGTNAEVYRSDHQATLRLKRSDGQMVTYFLTRPYLIVEDPL